MAIRDLIENDRLLISYDPDEPGHQRKLRELDFTLARRGIRFSRDLRGGWQYYTFVGLTEPLILCYDTVCMEKAVVGFRPKNLAAFLPACDEHKQLIREILGSSLIEEITYDQMVDTHN